MEGEQHFLYLYANYSTYALICQALSVMSSNTNSAVKE